MAELEKGYVNYLRDRSRQETSGRRLSCPLCDADVQPDINAFKAHVRADGDSHSALAGEADIEEAFRKMTINPPQQPSSPRASAVRPSPRSPRKRPMSKDDSGDRPKGDGGTDAGDSSVRGNKKMRSPPSSLAMQAQSSPPTTPSRSQKRSTTVSDFDRGESSKKSTSRQLWNAGDDPKQRGARPKGPSHKRKDSSRQHQHQYQHQERQQPPVAPPIEDTINHTLFRQPETNAITQAQLIAEVKGIYGGLVLIENKCIELDSVQSSSISAEQDLSPEQWQKLIGLHRSLLYEHHDFFLASQHPSANLGLRRLASKYQMPARMWRHGIHSFLEFLRQRLPSSLEYMLTFIYLSYSVMTLLYETVPEFVNTWIECLGDLGRYRMAIEDDDLRDRETWTGVSRYWYSMASGRLPTTGRLYHHLAILARPNALQQLYYYAKSLCVPIPFESARESIMTLFDPILYSNPPHLPPVDAAFVRVQGILFSGKSQEQLLPSKAAFLEQIDESITNHGKRWLEPGYFIGIILSCSLLGYGSKSNPLTLALSETQEEVKAGDESEAAAGRETAHERFHEALEFATQVYDVVLRRDGAANTLSCLHTTMVFLFYLSKHTNAMALACDKFPWKLTAKTLNSILEALESDPRMERREFPRPPPNEPLRPLPEDYALRGLRYANSYFPEDWFQSDKLEDDEKMFELPSLADERRQRILWLGRRIAASGKWLRWDKKAQEFSVDSHYDVDLDIKPY